MTLSPPRKGFAVLKHGEYARTLAHKLVGPANSLRNLLTVFGLRPYVVRLVRTRWSQGERGWGTEEVVEAIDLLPTPKVESLDTLDNVTQVVGSDEYGSLRVSQINGELTEDQICGRGPQGEPIPESDNFYWEIEFPNPSGMFPGERRRFELSGTPTFEAGKLQWVVQLVRAGENRTREGTPED